MHKIQIVHEYRKDEMRKIFDEYLTELAEFDPHIQFDENGKPIYKWFDAYWQEPDRFPFFMIIDGEIAGLSMIRAVGEIGYEVAEFYVLPAYRKNGNALWFAQEVLQMFEGQIELGTRLENKRAIKFWTKFVQNYDVYACIDEDGWRNWTLFHQNETYL